MWDTLDEKVSEIHNCCVDDRMTNLSTLEKLTNIENHISFLLQNLESIPEESLVMMRKIKDSERRSRFVLTVHPLLLKLLNHMFLPAAEGSLVTVYH